MEKVAIIKTQIDIKTGKKRSVEIVEYKEVADNNEALVLDMLLDSMIKDGLIASPKKEALNNNECLRKTLD